MMEELKVFTNERFGNLRAVLLDGEPWFVAADVCGTLGLTDTSRAVERLDDDEKGASLIRTPGGDQRMTIVTEPGLYMLVMRSRKREARAYQRWVTHEVLPSIRKHGAYATGDTIDRILADPDFGIRLMSELKQEREQRRALEAQTKQQAQLLRDANPKVHYHDAILRNPAVVPITAIAKDYGMSARAMNVLLHRLGIQYRIGDEWVLYQEYAQHGYTHSTTEIVSSGRAVTFTCWTQKGRRFLYDLLRRERGLLPLIERESQEAHHA